MNGSNGRSKYENVVEAEWQEVRPPWARGEILFTIFLGIMFIGGAVLMFLTSGLPNWLELKRHGEPALAVVTNLEFVITPGTMQPGDDYDRLTLTFRDSHNRYQKVIISDFGRWSHGHQINRHNPGSSLPKEAWIVYSRRNPEITELRDYRRHSWLMAGFSVLLAAAFPGFLYLKQREKRRAQRNAFTEGLRVR